MSKNNEIEVRVKTWEEILKFPFTNSIFTIEMEKALPINRVIKVVNRGNGNYTWCVKEHKFILSAGMIASVNVEHVDAFISLNATDIKRESLKIKKLEESNISLYNMNVHEEIKITCNTISTNFVDVFVLRVHGGWIYTRANSKTSAMVFVPNS